MDKKYIILLIFVIISLIVLVDYFGVAKIGIFGATAIGLSDTTGGTVNLQTTGTADAGNPISQFTFGSYSCKLTNNGVKQCYRSGQYNTACDGYVTSPWSYILSAGGCSGNSPGASGCGPVNVPMPSLVCNDKSYNFASLIKTYTTSSSGPDQAYTSYNHNSVNQNEYVTIDNKFDVGVTMSSSNVAPDNAFYTVSTANVIRIPSSVKNDIIVSIDSVSSTFEGTDAKINVVVNNNYVSNLDATVKIVYSIQNVFGTDTYPLSSNVIIPSGESSYPFRLPTNAPAYVTVNAQVYYRNVAITDVAEKKILINPKPISLPQVGDCTKSGINCPEGYTCDTDKTLMCLRTDVINNELACQEIGCPIVTDKSYSCQSTGFCSETVWHWMGCKQDIDCISVGGTRCDAGSGLCIKEELMPFVTKCTKDSDCPVACDGVTAQCLVDQTDATKNTCDYTGKCNIAVVQCFQDSDCSGIASPCNGIAYTCDENSNRCTVEGKCNDIYINIDCSKEGTGCPSGYDCVIAGEGGDDYVCKKDTKLDCKTTGCPKDYKCLETEGDWTCNKETTITDTLIQTLTAEKIYVIPWYVYAAISILVISLAIVILKWRGII